ncbi:integrase catalytic domain-containing protein [Vairimorpha necatrix]|uniref:Integrase catalytic domain-containing protein n=1 Tax=Vairimorpha necatrix TaxID=6039 RepID=A0AAX4J8A1_9MICR
MIGIDCIGPLPKCASGKRFIIVATDYVTKWVEAKAIKHKSAYEIAKFIMEEILPDMGLLTVSELFKAKFRYSSPYHLQSNGPVERTNQSFILKLSKFVSDYPIHWDKALPFALMQYRLSPIGKLGMSPFEMLYGRKAVLPSIIQDLPNDFEMLFTDPSEYLATRVQIAENTQDIINTRNRENILKEDIRSKRNDRPDTVPEGTIVFMRNRNMRSKLDKKFIGPYIVKENKTKGADLIKSLENDTEHLINRSDFVTFKTEENLSENTQSILDGQLQLEECYRHHLRHQ